MFVFLSKLLPTFVYPVGLASLLILAALFLRRREAWQRAALITAFALLFLGGNRWVTMGLARSLEWRYLPSGEIPSAQVIVVLGGGTDAPEAPRPGVELNGAGDRVLYAARLYKAGKAPALLLSGGNVVWLADQPSTPAAEMAEVLRLMGVPSEALWLQDRSQNTYEDARYSAQILREKGLTQVILVTSALHMPRAVALFNKQGIQVIPAPTDFRVTRAGWQQMGEASLVDQLVNFWPSASNLSATANSLKEYLGMWIYHLKGWL